MLAGWDFEGRIGALKRASAAVPVYAHRRFQHGPQYYHKAAAAAQLCISIIFPAAVAQLMSAAAALPVSNWSCG